MLPLQVSESSRKRSGKATRSWEDHHQQRNGASVMAPLLVKAVCARSGDQNVKGQLLVMGLLRTFLPNVFCERKAECQSLRQTEIFKRGSQRNTVKLLRPTGKCHRYSFCME